MLCWFVHSPADLVILARGPVKDFIPAHSTWSRPITIRYTNCHKYENTAWLINTCVVGRTLGSFLCSGLSTYFGEWKLRNWLPWSLPWRWFSWPPCPSNLPQAHKVHRFCLKAGRPVPMAILRSILPHLPLKDKVELQTYLGRAKTELYGFQKTKNKRRGTKGTSCWPFCISLLVLPPQTSHCAIVDQSPATVLDHQPSPHFHSDTEASEVTSHCGWRHSVTICVLKYITSHLSKIHQLSRIRISS